MCVLPNIALETAIGCDIAALAPANDCRVKTLKRTYPMLRRFLNRFTDNFGQKFEPAVLILNTEAQSIFDNVSAIASFRDVIALSAIIHSHALQLQQPRGHRVIFGEAFSIYPWMLDRDYKNVVGKTPAILGMHEVSSFKGQSSPSLFRTSLGHSDIDQPLLKALIKRWRESYETQEPNWQDVALMRSLNMAYHASLLPAGRDMVLYDVGRVVSIWVSAFEILVHPGGSGQANLNKVFEMIERTSWEVCASRELAYDTGIKNKVKRTLASWLYQVLYDCRNNFLHGNPVKSSDLIISASQRTIFEYAAPLYRIVLTAFLPLTCTELTITSAENPKAIADKVANHMDFIEPQKSAEKALLTAGPARLNGTRDVSSAPD